MFANSNPSLSGCALKVTPNILHPIKCNWVRTLKGTRNACALNSLHLGAGNRFREFFNTPWILRRGNYLWLFKERRLGWGLKSLRAHRAQAGLKGLPLGSQEWFFFANYVFIVHIKIPYTGYSSETPYGCSSWKVNCCFLCFSISLPKRGESVSDSLGLKAPITWRVHREIYFAAFNCLKCLWGWNIF